MPQPNRARSAARTRKNELPDAESRLQFETLLADLSTGFVHVGSGDVDAEILAAQRRICEVLDVDRSALFQSSDSAPGVFRLTHLHQSPDSPPAPPGAEKDVRPLFPWTLGRIEAGEAVVVRRMSDLPPEAARDLEVLTRAGTKATVVVPLSVGGGEVRGALTFAVLREERDWPEPVVKRFRLVAELFASALARKRAEDALRESEARLALATNAAGVGIWVFDPASGCYWTSGRTRELYDYAPDDVITPESVLAKVHPDDRERFLQVRQKALETGDELQVDYRLVRPDGSIRWIASRGRFQCEPSGGAGRFLGAAVDATERKRMEEDLRSRLDEIEQLKRRLEEENTTLREEIRLHSSHAQVVGRSDAMRQVLRQVEVVARTDSTVLLTGETGSGKGLIAQAIHDLSGRRDRLLVTVNCASLPVTLLEAELFGHEKGAYTGALSRAPGRFEIADGSTLFLDEIGDLPVEAQTKILRVLEEGRFERVGSSKPLQVNVRVLAATNRDLERRMAEGRFRSDLYYRLNVFPLRVPPLRDRREDIAPLVWAFVRQFGEKMGKRIERIPKRTLEALQSRPWPGNVRELRNTIERAMILSSGPTLQVDQPGGPSEREAGRSGNLQDLERAHILDVLERVRWRVNAAAEILGLNRTTLYARMKKLGIRRPPSERQDIDTSLRN